MKIKTLFLIIVILVAVFTVSKQPKFFIFPEFFQKIIKKYSNLNAMTIPPFGMFFMPGTFVDSTIRHELIHWEQYKRFGVLGFYILYFYYSLKYGYWDNPLEIEAYAVNGT